MKIKFFLALILYIGVASASSVSYEVFDDKVFVEIYFENTSALELRLPSDHKLLEINKPNSYEGRSIIIPETSDLRISYVTKSPLEGSTKRKLFIVDNQVNTFVDSITLTLPPTNILSSEKLVFPKDPILKTDGRSIILNWQDPIESEIIVAYESVSNTYTVILIVLIAIVILILILIYKEKLKFLILRKKKLRMDLTKNLFRDEKDIVDFLIENNKEAWTKEIQKGLNISKVKLSRKLKALEKKEVIKRIPFGNENKIRLNT